MNQDDRMDDARMDDARMEPTPEETGNPAEPSTTPPEDHPIPPEDAPTEASATPIEEAPAETAPAEAQAAAAEAPAPTPTNEAPLAEPPVYRWTYADQTAHEAAAASAKNRKGILIYALVMTGVFLVSFALLIAVLMSSNGSSGIGPLRPGITADDKEALAGVEKAKRSVVIIRASYSDGGSSYSTGIIMTENGYIATNHHVVEDATSFEVTFYDGTEMSAQLIGSSMMDDLGVIKVNATGLPAAVFADSDNCYVGQPVYVIGTPAGFDFGWTTTQGIISYKDREIKLYSDDGTLERKMRVLQTDAAVNHGNSGGPVVNSNGEVVGVVSMRLEAGNTGIGFAIPSDGAVEILNAIIRDGNADGVNSSLSHRRPMLGITGVYMVGGAYYIPNETGVQMIPEEQLGEYDASQLIHPEVSGIYVMNFTEGMDAASKMQIGDIITAIQGNEVGSMVYLMDVINDYYAGDTVTLTVYRNGKYIPVDIVLSAQPDQ